ncbi:PH domain-containing protein [Goodfellowiella coeruleoviolacea]|uniref:Membrane protein n=1 Tax=Goodfellowiella coeruleoviolacea TaxID=334858 RepID=A0AAE3KJI5_9PSEU|nr:PH domain-containing protein [Goodfellowiella coeruleoviolacea]MCP2169670.1 putative membrane protein [Goodfellowiella coeruleoviolacea]
MTATPLPPQPPVPTAEPAWRRLDPRTLAVHAAWLAAPLASTGLTALATGGRLDTRTWITLGAIASAFAVLTLIGLVRWTRTSYRVTTSVIEVRSGVLTRSSRSIPLHRVRNVDLTANPVHRLFGVTVLRIGTAGTADGRGELSLEALSRAAAGQLRAELLRRAEAATAHEPTLSTLDTRWLRYAPLTFWVFGGVFTVAGAAYRFLDDLGIEPWRIGPVRAAFTAFGASALWITIPLALLAITVLGSIGAVVVYAENWWRYRLEWTDPHTLRVRRGLLTTRSVSIADNQLRGVVLREPLLLRAGGGASVRAVAGGLGDEEENRRRSALLPPAPRAEALRVAAGVLREPEALLDRPRLVAHPRVALRRRVVRGMVFAVLPAVLVLAVLGALFTTVLVHCAWVLLVLSTPVVVWLARDAYRHLGHGLHGRYLLARSGVFSRDTVVLRRDGVLAWTFSSSPTGRRAGVVTLTAAVTAGEPGYRIPDLAEDQSVAFAHAAVPGVLAEFLEPVPPGPTR